MLTMHTLWHRRKVGRPRSFPLNEPPKLDANLKGEEKEIAERRLRRKAKYYEILKSPDAEEKVLDDKFE